MSSKWSTKLQNTALDAIKTAFTDGVIYIYSGSQPVNADAAVQGTLLGLVTLNAGAFSHGTATNGLEFDAAVDGVLSKKSTETWQFEGLANGVAGWFRFCGNPADAGAIDSSYALHRMDGRIATVGAEMNMSNTTITLGATSTIDTFSIAIPASFK